MVAPVNYALKFGIAGRTLFSKTFSVVPWRAFGKATLSDFHHHLPEPPPGKVDGYMVRSAELSPGECVSEPASHPPRPITFHNGRLLYIMETFPRHMTRLDGSFDDFLALKSAKTRSTLRRKVRRFAELSADQQVHWRTYQTPAEIESFLGLAVPLAQTTYQARLFDGALPDTDAFRRKAASLAEKGHVKAYLLFLQERPVAYLYTPLSQRAYIYAYLGYDSALAKMSPGTVLQYLVLESLFDDPTADYFDFTEGEGPHKALFATDSTNCCNALYLNNTWRNRMLVRAHYCWNRGVERIKSLLDRFELRSRLKRLFHPSRSGGNAPRNTS